MTLMNRGTSVRRSSETRRIGRSCWLRWGSLLEYGVAGTGEKGIPEDSEAGRRQFAALTEKRRTEESCSDYEAIRHDWVLGSEAFRHELTAILSYARACRPLRDAEAGATRAAAGHAAAYAINAATTAAEHWPHRRLPKHLRCAC